MARDYSYKRLDAENMITH